MKTPKILIVPALALALAGPLSAATSVLHIAGAATYRPPIQKAIEDVLKPGYTFAYYSGGRYKPTAAIYSGTLASNSQPIIIKTYWTGDVSGIVDLTSQNNISHWISSGVTLSSTGTVLSASYATETAPPDASVTITFPSSSAAVVQTAPSTGPTFANTINNADLIDAGTVAQSAQTLGIAPIQWAVGKLSSGTSPITNITQQTAFTLINGPTPVAFFDGNAADANKYAILVGRSEDAGARTVPLAEAQSGFGQSVQQYQLTFANNQTVEASSTTTQTGGVGSTVTGASLWPANAPLNTEPSVNWNSQGHSGYTLTTDLVNALSASNPVVVGTGTNQVNFSIPGETGAHTPTSVYLVGYAGPADIAGISGATALSYNGVPYSVAAVQSGQYTLWSFAHLYYFNSGGHALTGAPQKAADDIADQVYNTDAPTNSSGVTDNTQAQISSAGIFYNSSVLVTRQVEGGQVSADY